MRLVENRSRDVGVWLQPPTAEGLGSTSLRSDLACAEDGRERVDTKLALRDALVIFEPFGWREASFQFRNRLFHFTDTWSRHCGELGGGRRILKSVVNHRRRLYLAKAVVSISMVSIPKSGRRSRSARRASLF